MTDWLLSVLWYGAFLTLAIGVIAVFTPLRRFRLNARWHGIVLMVVSASIVLANARCAPNPTSISHPATALDMVAPTYHFREVHTRTVEASAARVSAAIKSVTADDISLFQLFTAIRRFGRRGPDSILNAPSGQPILDVATRTGFILLADTAQEVVLGTVVAAPRGFRVNGPRDGPWFRELSHPGVAKAAMNFLIEPESATRTRVVTETRVVGTSDDAVRRFTPYWRTIFPGSWILRVTWLDAIARRAES